MNKKTVMKTLALNNEKIHDIKIPDEFGAAINKIDYYDY